MNKKIKYIILTILIMVFALSLAACNAHTHDWNERVQTTPPACTEKGVEKRTCKTDSSHTETSSVEVLGHNWEWVETTPPSETVDGIETKICARCTATDGTRSIDEIGTNELLYVDFNGDMEYYVSIGSASQAEEIFIPATHQGKPVTYIGGFEGCTNLKSITFAEGSQIKGIDWYAFRNCTSLKSINIPASVGYIGIEAFRNCPNLESIIIPASVIEISTQAFAYCTNLESVTFAEGSQLKYIDDEVFYGCISLDTIIIPENVNSIGQDAFYDTKIFNDVPNNSVVYAGKWVIGYKGIIVNDIILKSNTVGIANGAFSNCENLETIDIPAGLAYIGRYAFWHCENLKSIVIPASLTYIANSAFAGCESITNIVIPKGIEFISDFAFDNCRNLETVLFEDGISLKSIGLAAFQSCESLENIVIPFGIIYIGGNAFFNSGIVNNAQNNSVVYLRDWLVGYKGTLIDIIVRQGTIGIVGDVFWHCESLKSIVIPASLTHIGHGAFTDCISLTKVFYGGVSAAAWDEIEIILGGDTFHNTALVNAPRYYYSEKQPTSNPQNFWHFMDGVPTIWQ